MARVSTSPGAGSPDRPGRLLPLAAGLDPRLVTTGVSAPCIRCLVAEEGANHAVAALHEKIFGDRPEEVLE